MKKKECRTINDIRKKEGELIKVKSCVGQRDHMSKCRSKKETGERERKDTVKGNV